MTRQLHLNVNANSLGRHSAGWKVSGADPTGFQVPPTPQGRPVLFQAGGSPQGIALAGKHADADFSAGHSIPSAQEYYRAVKAAAVANGRSEDEILVLPGLFIVLGSTEAEAKQRKTWLDGQAALQRRGIFRREYTSTTLRGHYGLTPYVPGSARAAATKA